MSDEHFKALNKLAKWRNVFTGWQLGTRLKGDPESDAVRDHREATILMRAEVNALVGLLLRKGVFTEEEWTQALTDEATMLDADYARRFPGITTTDDGLVIDPQKVKEHGTMKGWKP